MDFLNEKLDEGALQMALPGWRVVCLGRTISTNDEARRMALEGAPDHTVVFAEEQTAGRGRRGARWISPAGRNGILSVLLRPGPELPVEHWSRLTLAAALAGCDAMDSVPGLSARAEIKWPNDLYLSGRKVAGFLVESAVTGKGGAVVIGSGFNLNMMRGDFPPGLQESATSVWLGCGGLPVERARFLTDFLQALELRCRDAVSDFTSMRDEAWGRSWLSERRVSLLAGELELEGVAIGLGAGGELLLRMDDGEVRVISSADFVRPFKKQELKN